MLGLLAGPWGPASGAEGPGDTPGSCQRILDDRLRLDCYDRIHGLPDGAAAPWAQTPVPAARLPEAAESRSLIEQAWGFAPDSDRYQLGYFRQNYILFARYTDDVNQEPFSPIFGAAGSDKELDSLEARFQLSFKARAWTTDDRRWGVWLAYTQTSQWQVYSGDTSRPFRETNYEPELMVSFRPDVRLGSLDFGLLNFGINHQSNGRSQVLSRSWDRLFVEFGIERDQFAVLTKVWYRLPEGSSDDDNPDINRYMGYGEVTGIYKWNDHSLSLMLRSNWNTGKGAVRLSWTTPRLVGPLRGYVQAFSGYGDSMIDYNWKQNIIGMGVSLNDLL